MVAALELVDGYANPRPPDDLQALPWIELKHLPFERRVYQGKKVNIVKYQPRIIVDDVTALTELDRQGVGLATPAREHVEADLASGELIYLLPQ